MCVRFTKLPSLRQPHRPLLQRRERAELLRLRAELCRPDHVLRLACADADADAGKRAIQPVLARSPPSAAKLKVSTLSSRSGLGFPRFDGHSW